VVLEQSDVLLLCRPLIALLFEGTAGAEAAATPAAVTGGTAAAPPLLLLLLCFFPYFFAWISHPPTSLTTSLHCFSIPSTGTSSHTSSHTCK
jgi:hypothetical protein